MDESGRQVRRMAGGVVGVGVGQRQSRELGVGRARLQEGRKWPCLGTQTRDGVCAPGLRGPP